MKTNKNSDNTQSSFSMRADSKQKSENKQTKSIRMKTNKKHLWHAIIILNESWFQFNRQTANNRMETFFKNKQKNQRSKQPKKQLSKQTRKQENHETDKQRQKKKHHLVNHFQPKDKNKFFWEKAGWWGIAEIWILYIMEMVIIPEIGWQMNCLKLSLGSSI